jgi:hypothetical protein
MNTRVQYLFHIMVALALCNNVHGWFLDSFYDVLSSQAIAKGKKLSKQLEQQLEMKLHASLASEIPANRKSLTDKIRPLSEMNDELAQHQKVVAAGQRQNDEALASVIQTHALPDTAKKPLQTALSEQKTMLEDVQRVLKRASSTIERIIYIEAPEALEAFDHAQEAIERHKPMPSAQPQGEPTVTTPQESTQEVPQQAAPSTPDTVSAPAPEASTPATELPASPEPVVAPESTEPSKKD